MQDKEFAAILQDEPMQPLALVPLTEEEQVCGIHTPHKHTPIPAKMSRRPARRISRAASSLKGRYCVG